MLRMFNCTADNQAVDQGNARSPMAASGSGKTNEAGSGRGSTTRAGSVRGGAGMVKQVSYHREQSFAAPPVRPLSIDVQPAPTVSQPNPSKYTVVKKFTELYQLGEKLGEGGFAVVHMATDMVNTKHKVAVKIAKLDKLKDKDATAIRREFRILKGLDHRNIVKALGLYEEQQTFYFVLEFVCGGELFDRIVQKKQYFEKEARDAIRSVFRAIEYFHKHDIVHRDLKPENLLLTTKEDDADVKVADFGLAKVVQGNSITERVGTSQYLAPEVVEGRASGKAVDMWAAGVILFILLGGYSPFRNKDPQIMFNDICKGKFKFHPQRWSNVSEEAKDLIRALLTVDQNDRLTATQALAHPWIRADDEFLLEKELTDNLEELRQFNAARKLKAGVHVVRTVNMFLRAINQKKQSSSFRDENGDGSAPPTQSKGLKGVPSGMAAAILEHANNLAAAEATANNTANPVATPPSKR